MHFNSMRLSDFYKILSHFWWLFLLIIFLFTASTYYITANYVTPIYKAESKIFIGRERNVLQSLSLLDLEKGERLVVDYKELIKSNRVIKTVVKYMGIAPSPESLEKFIEVDTIDKSRFLSIIIRHSDPEFARMLANGIAEGLKDEAEEIVGAKNIQIVDYAVVPTEPDSPKPSLNAMIGFFVGIIVVLFCILLMMLSDTKIDNRQDVEALCNVPILGEVFKIKGSKEKGLVLKYDHDSITAEAFRIIRANLHYLNHDSVKKTLLFTSALNSEEKTTTIANVALAFALTGKKVLLVDCDLRKPKIHTLFDISSEIGLSSYLSDGLTMPEIVQQIDGIDNLSVICSGPISPNPSEMIGSKAFSELIEKAKQQYEIVLIDAPPILLASDGLNMVDSVDGVVTVVASRQSKKSNFVGLKESLLQVGYKIVGIVITKVPTRKRNYFRQN